MPARAVPVPTAQTLPASTAPALPAPAALVPTAPPLPASTAPALPAPAALVPTAPTLPAFTAPALAALPALAAVASLGAGAIHATAAGAHGDHRAAAVTFTLTAVAQL